MCTRGSPARVLLIYIGSVWQCCAASVIDQGPSSKCGGRKTLVTECNYKEAGICIS
jgi:hypothetical protein